MRVGLADWVEDRSRAREPEEDLRVEAAPVDRGGGFLARWLFLAGYRSSVAVPAYVAVHVTCVVLGAVCALALHRSPWVGRSIEWVLEVPGGFGGLFVPILLAAPWLVLCLLALAPVVVVRRSRRRIVEAIEKDLPLLLELLATLAEAGLGFDAALRKAVDAQDPTRPLVRELRTFLDEVRSGIPRVRALRRLRERMDVLAASSFVSALIQSETVGSGLTDTLRVQASTLWDRRRERVLAAAQVLPTKLAVPLVLCFLPPVFIFVLGPAMLEFFEIASGTIESAGG